MLCEKCGKSAATTHIKTNINGKLESYHMCRECATQMGYGPASFGMSDILGSLFGEGLTTKPRLSKEVRCDGCGMSFSEIARTGKVGCGKCYKTFYDEMLPSLRRMHGKTKHAGKVPNTASVEAKVENKLENLKAELNAAIAAQEFEKAATLRDEINALEVQSND